MAVKVKFSFSSFYQFKSIKNKPLWSELIEILKSKIWLQNNYKYFFSTKNVKVIFSVYYFRTNFVRKTMK